MTDPSREPRTFSLDLYFDWLEQSPGLAYDFSERRKGLRTPSTWQPVPPDRQGRIRIGATDEEAYLRLGVWGRSFNPRGAALELVIQFSRGRDAPPDQQATSPLDREITAALEAGVVLDERDVYLEGDGFTYWVLDPHRYGLPDAGLRNAPGSMLWFYYFPALTHGFYDLSIALEARPAARSFRLDPEMEVGESDNPPQTSRRGRGTPLRPR